MLRLIAAVLSALLLYLGLNKLCALLAVPDMFALAAMSCIFGSQMLRATVAHIANDYLAVPLTTLFLVWLMKFAEGKGRRDLLILALLWGAGLLTKAYFLAFAPVFVACIFVHKQLLSLAVPVIIAGPWYLHNLLLYGSFTGTQQAVAGIGFMQALAAVPRIPWASSTLAFLHWSVWTGNWSFLSFSKMTVNVELILLGVALLLYLRRFREFSAAEWWALAACACFVAGLVYQTWVTYVHTHGASLFAEPWYWQGVVCFLWVLAFRGVAQSGMAGRALALMLILLCAWIAAITYVAKLFPLYGGAFQRATWGRVWAWWTSHPAQDLSGVALAPPYVLYALLTLLQLILAAQIALIAAALIASSSPPRSRSTPRSAVWQWPHSRVN